MILVRKAEKIDFPSWAQMRVALWAGNAQNEHIREIEEFFEQKNYFQAWMALDGDHYVGFAEASIRPYANGCEGRPVVFLEGIWVDPKYQKKGIGQKLVSQVEDWARSLNIFEVASDAEVHNTISHQAHKHWGFEETERVVYFRKKLKL